ncbi:AE7-like 1 protein [Nymphaea thermarum]|nr:AE7-like 1 protein [Nymphaea thermarum]
MTLGLINANPVVHAKKERVARADDAHNDDDAVDALDISSGILEILSILTPWSSSAFCQKSPSLSMRSSVGFEEL